MAEIWHAGQRDVSRLVELAAREHAMSSWQHIPFDAMAAQATARGLIEGYGRTVVMSAGGYLAGLLQPMGFSPRMMAVEYAWFATDGQGLSLLARFERWAKNMGATELVVHNYTNDARLSRVLTSRRAYRRVGQAMTKSLEG